MKTVERFPNEEARFLHNQLIDFHRSITCRGFSKRQLKIIAFLLIFIVSNKKNECYIPTLSSFEATGITRSKIRYEIEKLKEANVILWDQEKMIFKLNLNSGEWTIECLNQQNRVEQIIELNKTIYKPR